MTNAILMAPSSGRAAELVNDEMVGTSVLDRGRGVEDLTPSKDPHGSHGAPLTLAASVRALRAHHRMSVAELARRSGVSRYTIYKMEDAIANPRLDNLEQIARALGVTVGDLFAQKAL